MTQEQRDQTKPTKAELLQRIDAAWMRFTAMLAGLTEAQRSTARDAQGWTVKDHLAHITAWEQSLLALLQRRNRNQAIGLDDRDPNGMDIDQENALIQQKHQHRSYQDVLAAFERSHQQVLDMLNGMSDDDLMQPYSLYQPDSAPDESQPVFGWVVGNTFEHYAEHQGWIEEWVYRENT